MAEFSIPAGACALSLAGISEKAEQGESWARQHWNAWTRPTAREQSLRDMIVAWARYGVEHRLAYDVAIGKDGFLGPVYVDMGRALLRLLNGDLGRFDGGTLDRLVCAIATENGLELE